MTSYVYPSNWMFAIIKMNQYREKTEWETFYVIIYGLFYGTNCQCTLVVYFLLLGLIQNNKLFWEQALLEKFRFIINILNPCSPILTGVSIQLDVCNY